MRGKIKLFGSIANIAAGLLATMAVVDLVGHICNSDLMTAWNTTVRMSVPTAVCFLTVALVIPILSTMIESLDNAIRDLPCSKTTCVKDGQLAALDLRIKLLETKTPIK